MIVRYNIYNTIRLIKIKKLIADTECGCWYHTDTDAEADAAAGADADADTDCWKIYLYNFDQHDNELVHVAQYENEHTLSLSQPGPLL